MANYNVINQAGEKVSSLTLNDSIFGLKPNRQVIYDVVNAQRAAMRQGTHDVKNRSEVSGGGKKPWRQKGTGRARQGSIRSPQWRGGGVVFGPTPRSYDVKVNHKVRRLALKNALSYHAINNQLVIIDKLVVETPKTKDFKAFLDKLNLVGKIFIVTTELTDELVLASRNIPNVKVELANHTSVYDILNTKNLVLTQDAINYFEEALK